MINSHREFILDLKKRLLNNADAIFGDTPALLAYFYGSCAIGQSHTFSDLDIAIYLRKPLNISESIKLEMDLALRIDSVLLDGPPSDVRIMNHLPIAIAGQIITEGSLIYSIDEETRVEYETFTRRLYFDFLPFVEKYQREYLFEFETG